MSAYGEAALDREIGELSRLTDGRHKGLCRASVVLGQLVGAGALDRSDAKDALFNACRANGYLKKRGESATKATIATGLDRGIANPRPIDGDARKDCSAEIIPRRDDHDDRRSRDKAQWLWRQRQPIIGSIAERYLRQARGYSGTIPATLAYLPASGDHAPALIAAFGLPDEPEPGALTIVDDAVTAVQIIRVKPDGSGKADIEPQKITIGRARLDRRSCSRRRTISWASPSLKGWKTRYRSMRRRALAHGRPEATRGCQRSPTPCRVISTL